MSMRLPDDNNSSALQNGKDREQHLAFEAQITQLYKAGFSALLAMPVAGIVLFLALRESLPLELNVLWLTSVICISAVRGILLHAYSMRNPETPITRWSYYYCLLEVLSGLAWGCTGFFLSYVGIEHQVLIFFILIGMVGGAAAMLAPIYASYVCFSLPALATFSLFLSQLHNEIYTYMIILMLFALTILLNATRTLTRYINRTHLLAFENETLSLTTQEINQQLRDQISSRQQYEEKLHTSERRLSGILHNMQDTYYRTNIHGEISIVSSSVEKLLGYTPEELQSTSFSLLCASAGSYEQYLQKLNDGNGTIVSHQAQLRHKDGHLVWVSTNAQYYFDDQGVPQGIEGTTRNVDDIQNYIKQLEDSRQDYQRLYEINQNILEHSPIGIMFIDKDACFSYINNNMQQILGVPENTRHLMLGQRFLDIPALAKSGLRGIAKQLLDGERQSLNIPYTSMYNKSSILAITAVPLQERGQFAGAIILADDITDKVAREKQLITALQKADAANQTKSRFLANVSHELRTPLNAIIGMTSLLRQSAFDKQHQENLEIIQHSGENLLSLVNTILTLTQLEQGNYIVNKEVIELNSYLFSLLRPYIDEAEKKQLKFIFETDPQIPHPLMVDTHALEYSLMPLVENAVKFTRHGHVKFSSRLMAQQRELVQICFSIEDTGGGMTEQQEASLFDYFSISDDSSRRKHGGLGLGASVARQLILASGGTVQVHNEQNQGVCIEVTLPIELTPEIKLSDEP